MDTVLREVNYGDLRLLTPPVYEGVKCMSYGFVRSKEADAPLAPSKLADPVGNLFAAHASASAVMRGPMLSNVVRNQSFGFTTLSRVIVMALLDCFVL